MNDISRFLRDIDGAYTDRLRPASRQRILREAVDGLRGRTSRPVIWSFVAPMAAAAIVVVLMVPALYLKTPAPEQAGKPITDLQVTNDGGHVVLTWSDGDAPRRVIRATSREELARAIHSRGELVSGERWVDPREDNAKIVYYVVN